MYRLFDGQAEKHPLEAQKGFEFNITVFQVNLVLFSLELP